MSQPRRSHPHLRSACKWALVPVVVSILAVPYICLQIHSFARYGHRWEARRCTPGRRRNQKRWTEDEWRKLALQPDPEVLEPDWPDTSQERYDKLQQEAKEEEDRLIREEEDRVMGILPSPTSTRRAKRKWKPRGPFRFTHLPRDIQLLILDHLVNDKPKWIAGIGFCKDGFVQYYGAHHAGSKPSSKVQQPRFMQNRLAVWRSGNTPTTRSLLLTSREMRELSHSALTSSFSGTLKCHGRQRTSQLDTPWPWHAVGPRDTVVQRHAWLFHRVRRLETPQLLSAWRDVLDVMPNLECILLTPHYISVTRVPTSPGGQVRIAGRSWLSVDGENDVVRAAVDAGHHWIEWCKQRESDGQRTIPVSITVTIMLSGHSTEMTRHALVTEVRLWPQIGLVVRNECRGLFGNNEKEQIVPDHLAIS